jgi:hypothetical protein
MPHLYVCRQCRTQSPEPRGRREDAEADRQQHRDAVHGGHAPLDGDEVRPVHAEARGDGFLPRHTFFAALFLLALILANCHGR